MKKEKGRGGHKEKHRLKQNAKLQDRIGSVALETTYFPNANNSGECGNIQLVSLKICGHLLTPSKLVCVELEEHVRWKLTGYVGVHITGCAGK